MRSRRMDEWGFGFFWDEVYEGFGGGLDVHRYALVFISLLYRCQYRFSHFTLDMKERLFAIAFRRAEFFRRIF